MPVIRHLCRDSLVAIGVSDQCVFDIEVAVTEASTNVLQHAAARDDNYRVDVRIDERVCEIRVVDLGSPTSNLTYETEGLEAASLSSEKGRGIHLMRTLVDKLEFVAAPEEGAVVHLVKSLDLREDSILHRLAAGVAQR